MELKVIGKRLFTDPLDGAVTEGEFNADVIGITLERFHDGADLSEYGFRISAYSEDKETIAENALAMDKVGESSIHLLWTVTSMFTAESGIFTLTLAGVSSDNSAQIKFTSGPVRINADGRAEFIPEKTVLEQYLNQVQLEANKAAAAALRAESAAEQNTAVPAATEEKLGGILSGGDVSVDDDGAVTVNSVGGKTVLADVPADAKFTDTVYSLPPASSGSLGGVKPDGVTITADANGVISAAAGEAYVLPKATESVLGGVKVDGSTVTVDENGVISASAGEAYVLPKASGTVLGGVKVDGITVTADENGVISAVGGGGTGTGSDYVLPKATESVLGGVMVDGTTVTVNENGVISAAAGEEYVLPKATESVLGGVKVDGSTVTVDENGVISAAAGEEYVLPKATESVLGGVKPDSSTLGIDENGVISVKNSSHSHSFANIIGLQGALDGKADISAIPASLPANGGNAATVNGFTVGKNVPADAVFTDTVYTLPPASASSLGGVKVDGTTITADAAGVISALTAGSGITIDKIHEHNYYWSNDIYEYINVYVKLPHPYTYWDYLFVSTVYCDEEAPWFGYNGTALIKTSYIVSSPKASSSGNTVNVPQQHITYNPIGGDTIFINFPNTTHILFKFCTKAILWGIKMPDTPLVGTVVNGPNA